MAMENDGEYEVGEEGEEMQTSISLSTMDAKLKELLHKICSVETKLCSDGAKEFIKLLKGSNGGELLKLYARSSSGFSELLEAWMTQDGKPGISYVLSLVSAILSHQNGMYRPNNEEKVRISRVLDKFAKLIIEEKMEVLCKELAGKNGKDGKGGKRKKTVLMLLASIVRRGSGLASEVARNFDFKLHGFSKLAEYNQEKNKKVKISCSTRKSFVGFAMSFLEVGKPGFLRSILQQKEMYFGVLRRLVDDDEETIVYVLSTLRDRILTEESLVPPGLRSVLFGSVTLEQLSWISGEKNGGLAAEVAHQVLLMVCTDSCNGLMPDFNRHPTPLRGNTKRLMDLMKKLKATETGYHRDLLLSVIRGRPYLGSAYMEDFPYNLEDFVSPTWFAVVALASDVLASVGTGVSFGFLSHCSQAMPSLDCADSQSIINCIAPRACSRSVFNKGLLHADIFINHGSLRLLLEMLKLLDSFIKDLGCSFLEKNAAQNLASLKQEVLNEVRSLLPDPQVLLTLFKRDGFKSLLTNKSELIGLCLKRNIHSENDNEHNSQRRKRLKVEKDVDILVGGINLDLCTASLRNNDSFDALEADDQDSVNNLTIVISDIWRLDPHKIPINEEKDAYTMFYSNLLDALQIYLRTMPALLEGSFDFFMNLLSDPLALPLPLQRSFLSLLIEYTNWPSKDGLVVRCPPNMYKHLAQFINLLTLSPIRDIKDKAYDLARAAMSSTGAFCSNLHEIDAWLLFLPGYSEASSFNEGSTEMPYSSLVISFLCDAVSSLGKNLFRYMDIVRHHTCRAKGFEDASPDFSPLVASALEKCQRLLNSNSGNYELHEKSMISSYVSNTLKYIVQTQVDARLVCALMESILSEGPNKLEEYSGHYSCEWRQLKNLLLYSQSILHGQSLPYVSLYEKAMCAESSFTDVLTEVEKSMESGQSGKLAGIAKAFSCTMTSTTPDVLLKDFPAVITIVRKLQGVCVSHLSATLFNEQNFLAGVSKLWPEIFDCGLEAAVVKSRKDDAYVNTNFGVSESADGAFSYFLSLVPFHVLFPSVISTDGGNLLKPKMQDLLLAKLYVCPRDRLISHLHLVLFWFHQTQAAYRNEPLSEFIRVSETCFKIIDHLLAQLFAVQPDSDSSDLLSAGNLYEVADAIFSHPAVTASFTRPLGCKEIKDVILGDSLEMFLFLSRQRLHIMDCHIMDTLKTTCRYLFSQSHVQHLIPKRRENERLAMAFTRMVQQLLMALREKFDRCIRTEDLKPLVSVFYVVYELIHFISPLKLLELAHWVFGRVDKDLALQISCEKSALSFGFYIACGALENLSWYSQQPAKERQPYDFFWEMEERKVFDVELIDNVYMEICYFFAHSKLNFADTCILNVIKSVYRQKYLQHYDLHPLSLIIARTIMHTPVNMISYFIDNPSTANAKTVFFLTKMSPLHLSVFGYLVLCSPNDESLMERSVLEEDHQQSLSDEEFIILLPAALSYFKWIFMRTKKQYHQHFCNILAFYSGILLKGFLQWKYFSSKSVFCEEYGEFLPSSVMELLHLVNRSVLGNAIRMLQYHSVLSGDSMKLKKRLKLFNSVFPESDSDNDLIDCNCGEIDYFSVQQSLNLINKVVAKISFCRMLLFPEENQIHSLQNEVDGNSKKILLRLVDHKMDSSRLRFLDVLTNIWRCLVKKFPSFLDNSRKGLFLDCFRLFTYLEAFILRTICHLTTKMYDQLNNLQAIPFLDHLMKLSLLHRFEDPSTLKMLRNILISLSKGKFSRVPYLEMLLSHSQFAPTIQSIIGPCSSHTGAYLRPLPSILQSLVFHNGNSNKTNTKNDTKKDELFMKRMEVIKLLKVLLHSQHRQQNSSDLGNDSGINLRELHFLLLSSYGATLSEFDLEIYDLMRELESIENSCSENISQMDYLWGVAASKVRKERDVKNDVYADVIDDAEPVRETRKCQFRENLLIDPKKCTATALYFPYDRTACGRASSLSNFQLNDTKDSLMAQSLDVETIQRYDPVFILRWSIHTLSAGYFDAVEFASSGLLALAFVSMSSPDIEMRKLGYEALGKLNNILEISPKKKDVTQVRLLLTYVQNSIEEPWQRIPSVISIFAAEASVQLLDLSHDHHATLKKILLHSSKINLKRIPHFDKFFFSISANYKTERLWMLRLVYAGINSHSDSDIYIKNSVFRNLQSFYISPHSDLESKELILQVVKKSVKLHKTALVLVEQCALFSWLSSVVSFASEMVVGDGKGIFLRQLTLGVEIAREAISSRKVRDWLQENALEQLMELSTQLYRLFDGDTKLINENVFLVHPILEIIRSTLKMSQKRKKYQPHFTISFEGLFNIYQAVSKKDTVGQSGVNANLGLKVVLMSLPSVDILHMNQEKLSSFLIWTISTALKSDSERKYQPKGSHHCEIIFSEKESYVESRVSKLLRWLIASVILGTYSRKQDIYDPELSNSSKSKTLNYLMLHSRKLHGECYGSKFGCEEVLASTILYLQQLVGIKCYSPSSVISALCLLLFNASNSQDFSLDDGDNAASLLLTISCGAETNPAWRWSFYQPWKDRSIEVSDLEKIDELHACQVMLARISNYIGMRKSLDSKTLFAKEEDTAINRMFEWERNFVIGS